MQTSAPNSSESGGTATYLLRWRGKTSGPFSLAEIEYKLRRQEIGLLHEIGSGGRWIKLRDFKSGYGYGPLEGPPQVSAQPSVTTLHTAPSQPQAVVAPGEERLYLRWRGKTRGPLGLAEIEQEIDRQEIGMLHEVSVAGRWITLNDFFVRRNAVVATTRATTTAPSRPRFAPTGKLGARMVLQDVTQQLKHGARILDEISLVVEPNEFVALLGPSGSGKSTLMNAMTGRRRASSGHITLNGEDFYANAAKYRERIGHVPQKDIVHFALSVQQELAFSAKLRLPAGTPKDAIYQRVSDVINQIGLPDRADTRISDLSGGQLKRVSLGVELLSDPELLFLDEATSGLDAGTEARMMSLFRRLADSGRTVVCITHNLENVCLCDLVILLTAGRLVYYGPPSDLLTHFGLAKLSQVYDCLETRTPDEWTQHYLASEYYRKYIVERQGVGTGSIAPQGQPAMSQNSAGIPKPQGALQQFLVLTHRYFTVTLQDRRNVILLLAQAPIIALLLGLVFRNENFNDPGKGEQSQRTLSFLLMVSAIWFGCINSAREIVKELPIYLRERAINLRLGSYLGSKVTILSFLCILQCAALMAITLAMTPLHPRVGIQIACLLPTAVAGMLMGLFVSALVKSEDKAMAIIPILLIPQVIFSGAILTLSGLAEAIAKWIVVSYWAFDGMLHALPPRNTSVLQAQDLLPQNLLPTHDLLKPKCTFGEDILTISLFLFAFLALTTLALKRKDPLK